MRHFLLAIVLLLLAALSAADVAIIDDGPKAYLDVADQDVVKLGISPAVEDLTRFIAEMTGESLPRSDGDVALFDPTLDAPTEFACAVGGIEDLSAYGAPNASVAIVLTPTRVFERNPFAGPGEKVVWTCTWDRAAQRLNMVLGIANEAYYGPGHGPREMAVLEATAPDFAAGEQVALSIEMRGGASAGVRAGYQLGGGEWVTTDWVDPTTAGTDDSVPGESDKNGPQAWGEDWTERWAGKTALFVTGYAPKGREGRVSIDGVTVRRGGAVLMESDFGDGLSGFSICPAQGTATVEDGLAVLAPDSDGWSTVGLRALLPPKYQLSELTPITVELAEYPPGADPYDAELAQGFEVEASGERIALRAHTSVGLGNAIYYLLDAWGCRFVMPGAIGECIPTQDRLAVPEGVTRFSPRSDLAVECVGKGGDLGAWYRRNMGDWHHWLTGQHYWLHAISPEKEFEDHPEWFALTGGERRPTQLCTSNPEVIARMIEVAKRHLGESPQRMSFPMDPADSLDYCQCEDCQALDAPGEFTRGSPSVTDRVLAFANEVAEGIREDFPDQHVALYSYWSHSDLPLRVKPAENVVVIVCRSSHCLVHLTPTKACPTSDFHGFLREWRKLTPNIYSYEYDPISWTGGLPCPTYLEVGRSLKEQLGGIGVHGSYSDGQQYAGYVGTYVNRYIARRMKVDPTQRPTEVLADMCQAFFGPAGEAMNGYYRHLARITEGPHPRRQRIGGGTTFYHELFTPEIVGAARADLDRGIGLVGDEEPFATRIAMVAESQAHLEGYVEGVWRAQAGDRQASEAAFDAMVEAINLIEARGKIDGPDARRRAKTMRLKALAEHFADEMGFVRQWKVLGPFDNSTRDATLRVDAPEPITSLDGADWWEYESPGGFVNLETALAGKLGDWVLSYAYAGTIYEAEEATVAQLRMDSFHPFKVFVNGEEVYHRPGLDADAPDKRKVDVKLKQGPNVIVLKLGQTQITTDAYPWGLYFRVVIDDTREDVAELPREWAFKTDPDNVGTDEAWESVELDDGDWMRIPVGKAWEETAVGNYDGYGWYRARFALPAEAEGTDIAAAFGGVDEQAWVYVNGKYIGERTEDSTGTKLGEFWDAGFEIPVPAEQLKFGEENLLAVRVHDWKYAGGIFRGVRLLGAKK